MFNRSNRMINHYILRFRDCDMITMRQRLSVCLCVSVYVESTWKIVNTIKSLLLCMCPPLNFDKSSSSMTMTLFASFSFFIPRQILSLSFSISSINKKTLNIFVRCLFVQRLISIYMKIPIQQSTRDFLTICHIFLRLFVISSRLLSTSPHLPSHDM